MNNLRAWYKPDLETKDGALKFNLEITPMERAWFVCESDRNIRYPIEIPFIDNDWIIEQSTRMEDRNGVEIFEGDIFKGENWDCVKYRDGSFYANLMGARIVNLEEFYDIDSSPPVVIGNIHQNNLDGSPKLT